MIRRSSMIRSSAQLLKRCNVAPAIAQRGFATPAGGNPFVWQLSDSAGVKVVSKDSGSPTSSLAIVAKAGSRYETAPGLAHALEHYAFKNTTKRSAQWITREVELFGGILETSLSRENIVFKARFLRHDLPYFVELMSDVLTKTKFDGYELKERVGPSIHAELQSSYAHPGYVALEAAHSNAFHRGLGLDRLAVITNYISDTAVAEYAEQVYNSSNIAIVGSGIEHSELTKYTGEFFQDVGPGSKMKGSSSTYHGGETRLWGPSGNAMVVAFPGTAGQPDFKPEFMVLSYVLGGESTIKWNPGTSLLAKAVDKHVGVKAVARNLTYSDTGLLCIALTGPPEALRAAAPSVAESLKGVANLKAEDLKRAVSLARFDLLAAAEDNALSLEAAGQSAISGGKVPSVNDLVKAVEGVSLDAIKKAASTLIGGKASVGTVGDLHILPYADEIGLNV